jgi:hypothetical protein
MYSLLVVFLQYDTEKYQNSFVKLKELIDESKCNVTYINVNNRKIDSLEVIRNNCHYISGDNSCWEFSGWDAGMKYAQQQGIKSSAILFINDAWMAYGWNFLKEIDLRQAIEGLKLRDVLIGHIDTKGYQLKIDDFDVTNWICTNAFLMNENIYLSLGRLISYSIDDINSVLPAEFENQKYFLSTAKLSTSYQNMLVEWLTKEWHGKLTISDKNWTFFKMKVLAMINESLLTARIKRLGFEVLSYKIFEKQK